MEARLFFTKETKQKIEKGTDQYTTGMLRFKKIKELAQNGGLDFCKNRLDIVECLGFERRINNAGYNWVSSIIRKGYLSETLVKFNKQNSAEYEYHLTGIEPNYTGNKVANKMNKAKPTKATQKEEQQKIEAKITLVYGDMRIEKEGLSKNFVINIINNLSREI